MHAHLYAHLLCIAISRCRRLICVCTFIRYCNLPCPQGPSSSRVRVLVLRLCMGRAAPVCESWFFGLCVCVCACVCVCVCVCVGWVGGSESEGGGWEIWRDVCVCCRGSGVWWAASAGYHCERARVG